MSYRLLSLLIISVLLAGAALAKPRVDPQTFIDRSDKMYYYPQAAGVTDLAVDINIPQLVNDQAAGKALITFCYLEGRHEFVIGNLNERQENIRLALLSLVGPLGEYVAPRTSAETFTGMKIGAVKVLRQLSGLPGMTYYQLTGTPEDEKSPLKEYRVLIDEHGLAHQVETEGRDGGVMTARIVNTQIGEHWFITKISTRMMNKDSAQWEIASIKYHEIEGITLPEEIVVQHRNAFDQPIKEIPDFTFTFMNYRINTGDAARLLPAPAPEPAAKPEPDSAPEPAVDQAPAGNAEAK